MNTNRGLGKSPPKRSKKPVNSTNTNKKQQPYHQLKRKISSLCHQQRIKTHLSHSITPTNSLSSPISTPLLAQIPTLSLQQFKKFTTTTTTSNNNNASSPLPLWSTQQSPFHTTSLFSLHKRPLLRHSYRKDMNDWANNALLSNTTYKLNLNTTLHSLRKSKFSTYNTNNGGYYEYSTHHDPNAGYSGEYNDDEAYDSVMNGELSSYGYDEGCTTTLSPNHQTIHLEEGVDYIFETTPDKIFHEFGLDEFMAKALDLPLMTCWPRLVEKFSDPIYNDTKTTVQRHDNDGGDIIIKTQESLPTKRKVTQFEEGNVEMTIDEFKKQQEVTATLNQKTSHIDSLNNTIDLTITSDFVSIVNVLLELTLNINNGDTLSSQQNTPNTSRSNDNNNNNTNDKRKLVGIQFSEFDSMKPEHFKFLQESLVQSSEFIEYLAKSHSTLQPIIVIKSIILDLLLTNSTIPATTFARHLYQYVKEHTHDRSTIHIIQYLTHRSFQRKRYGLVNLLTAVTLESTSLPLFNDILSTFKQQSEEYDMVLHGDDNDDMTQTTAQEHHEIGSPMFDDKKAKLLRLRQNQLESGQSFLTNIDVNNRDKSNSHKTMTIFSAPLKAINYSTTTTNTITTQQNTQNDTIMATPPSLSGIGLAKLAGVTFHHDALLQHYTLMLHSIIEYFQSPLATRKLHTTYDGYPYTLEGIVQHGYRLCAILMNPEIRRVNPAAFYSTFPLMLAFYLTCQDTEKYNQTITYFQENIASDYRKECFEKYNIDTNIDEISSPLAPNYDLTASRDQLTIDSMAADSSTDMSPAAKLRLKNKMVQFIDHSTQTIELILSHSFTQKDYTTIFNLVTWAEHSGLIPRDKITLYRNRLYAESDDNTFISFFTHKLMSISQHDQAIQDMIKKNSSSSHNEPSTRPLRPPIANIVHNFYNSLFNVLPSHPTISSLSTALTSTYGHNGVKRLSQDVLQGSAEDMLEDAKAFFLPKAFSAFLNDVIHSTPAQHGIKTMQSLHSDKKTSNNTKQGELNSFNTMNRVLLQDINPNVIKTDPLTQNRFIEMPAVITSDEVIKFHQIGHKIQYHANKIRAKIERTFPEFESVKHYHPSHFPYININGENIYLTQDIDQNYIDILTSYPDQQESALKENFPHLTNQDVTQLHQQYAYNSYLQRSFKELWVKHITPPMHRILDKNELGLLHLYTLCEPILQSSAVDIISTSIRRPLPIVQSATLQGAAFQKEKIKQDNINSILDFLSQQNSTLLTDLNRPLSAHIRTKSNVELYSTGEIRDPVLPKPQFLRPVSPEQSILSQYPAIIQGNNTTKPEFTTNTNQNNDANDNTDLYQPPQHYVKQLHQDPYSLISSQHSSIIALNVNSNLYLIKKALLLLKSRLATDLKNRRTPPSDIAELINTRFSQLQTMQYSLLQAGLIHCPYDTTEVVSLMHKCTIFPSNDPIARIVQCDNLPTRPLELNTESEIVQDRAAAKYIKKKLYSFVEDDQEKKNENFRKKQNTHNDDDLDDVIPVGSPNSNEDADNTDNEDGRYVRKSKNIGIPDKDGNIAIQLPSGIVHLPASITIPTQLDTYNLITSTGMDHDNINNHNNNNKDNQHYDITKPLTTDEIEIFNEIYERANYNPDKDSVWRSQIPGLARILSLFNFTFKLGSLPDRTMYTMILQHAYNANLPNFAVKMFNLQQLSMIPYVTPQVNITTTISLLECGKINDARGLVSKMDLFSAHGPVLITMSRLATHLNEYNIPLYILRSLLNPLSDVINNGLINNRTGGNGQNSTTLSKIRQLQSQSTNLLLLTRMLHYTLELLVPSPKSTQAIIYKAKTRLKKATPDGNNTMQNGDLLGPYNIHPITGAEIDPTKPPHHSTQDVLWDCTEFTQYDHLPADYLTSIASSDTSTSSETTVPEKQHDSVLLALELGLELQKKFNLFTLLLTSPVSPQPPPHLTIPYGGASSQSSQQQQKFISDVEIRQNNVNILRQHVDRQGVYPRDMSRLLLQLVFAAQLANQPRVAQYFRDLIQIIEPDFIDRPNFSPSANIAKARTQTITTSLQSAQINQTDAGIRVVNTNNINNNNKIPQPTPEFQQRPKVNAGAAKRNQKVGKRNGVNLSKLDDDF